MSTPIKLILTALLVLGGLTACSSQDQESCNNLYGGGYVPTKENGNIYCENHLNGVRYLLRGDG